MENQLRILHLEDDAKDRILIRSVLESEKILCHITAVDKRRDFTEQLQNKALDLILSDYTLPDFDGLSALVIAKEQRPEVPFIFVSGTMGEEFAIECLKRGAMDYVLKSRLSRLGPAVRRALQEVRLRNERRTVENALRANEEKFRCLFHHSNDGIVLWDETDCLIDVNQKALDLLQYEKSELLALKLPDLFPPEHADRAKTLFREIAEQGFARFETILQTKFGQSFPAEVSASTFAFDGRAWGQAIIRDFTERRQKEQALQEKQRQLEQFLEAIPLGIFIINEDGTASFANQFARNLLGKGITEYTVPEELAEVYQAYVAGTDQLYPTERMPIVRALSGECTSVSDMEIQLPERRVPIQVWGAPVKNSEGKITHAIAMFADITKQKQAQQALWDSEEKYRRLFEESKDGIFITTPEGELLDINPAGAAIFGYTSREEMLNTVRAVDLYYHPGKRKYILEELDRVGYVKDYEFIGKQKDGQPVTALLSESIVENESGNMVFIQGIVKDITEKKRLEEQLRHAQKMEAIGVLAGGIAHDFNNILTAILGYAEITRNLLPEGSLEQDNLKEIYLAGIRAKDIVQQILTFSRKNKRELKPLQVSVVLKEALKLLRASLPATIEFKVDIAEKNDWILGDATEVHQVIMNLCTNAYHAMSNQRGKLQIMLKPQKIVPGRHLKGVALPPGEYLMLSVIDNGWGMDGAIIERIFDPFFTTKPIGEGTGLGLSVVHGIVTGYGGYIKVHSQPGDGTTFEIYFPLYRGLKKDRNPAAITPPKGGGHILYIDDEAVLTRLFKQLVEGLGYRTTTANSPREGLEILREQPDQFDLIITDFTMPQMTGLEFAQECQKIRQNMPIMLTTGNSDPLNIRQINEQGIRGYIKKPFNAHELARKISGFINAKGDGR